MSALPSRRLARLAGLALALWLGVVGAVSAAEAKRIALVIGNAAYPNSPLVNPLNDARAVSDSLRRLGFQVVSLENASQKQMFDAVRTFGDGLRNSVGLFYYAGHGVQVKGRNFLVPVDAHIEREDEVAYKAFDVSQVLEKMETAKNPLNIIILDACRNNPFARTARSGGGGLAQMDAPSGSIVAFATAPGAEASDGSSGHGLYTAQLLRHMNTPGLKVEDVFKRTRVGVRQGSGGRQIPWESTSLEGDFYFAAGSGAAPAATPSVDLDQEMWQLVADSGQTGAYRAYLEKFPQGRFVDQARNKVAQAATPERSAGGAPQAGRRFSFSEEEEKMDRATVAGREVAFERQLTALECPLQRRRARVSLQIDEPSGSGFGLELAQRLRQAGWQIGPGGDYQLVGTVSSQRQAHRVLRVQELSLNAALQLFNAKGVTLASSLTRGESFAGGNGEAAWAELQQGQALDAAGQLVAQFCRN